MFHSLRNALAHLAPFVLPAIPQARSGDTAIRYRLGDHRKHIGATLRGRCLEIGAADCATVSTRPGLQVEYLDYFTPEQLRQMYQSAPAGKLTLPDIVDDAQTMTKVPSETYDALVASHVIEHMKNPIGAIEQWVRVLKPAGVLYLITPDKRTTFDKPRPRTTLEHLVLDYQSPSAERDLEHALEISIYSHGLRAAQAVADARHLLANRPCALHYHTFIPQDMAAMIQWFAANVHPVTVTLGPVMRPASVEFHMLIRKD